MKPIATRWRSMPSTGYRDCKRSEPTPRRNSVTNKSNAGPTRTRTASMRPRLPDGGGRTAPSDRAGVSGWPVPSPRPPQFLFTAEACYRTTERKDIEMSVATVPPPLTPAEQSMDLVSINTIRTLSIDAIQAANSGHPGTPMGMAPVAYTLWQEFLRFDPQDPVWPNRDRFVLSAGHASMLLYSLLHLTEVRAVSKDYETLGEPSV